MRPRLSYPEVGASLGELPSGYRCFDRTRVIGRGEGDFRRAGQLLMTWQVHRRAGLEVVAAARVEEGEDVALTIPLGPVRLRAACRVVATVDEPRRLGFAYGTLAGHPERGEQLFVVEWLPDDAVQLRVRAFSRPARWWSRLGGPVTRRTQDRYVDRYLDALRR